MSRSNPVTLEQALTQVRDLLDNDRPRDAIDLIAKFGANNSELRNAYGVCLMRAEEYEKALDVYRNLCVGQGVALKSDAPVVHLVNYATALLLQQNVEGCLDILQKLRPLSHSAAIRLQTAVDRWRQSLPWWQRLGMKIGAIEPNVKVKLDFPPGGLS